MTRPGKGRWAAVAVVLLATVAGCTGVPASSGPEVVRTVGLGEAPQASVPAPPNGASQRDIVKGFLDAMAASPDQLDAARAYLDPDASAKWTGNTVTIVRSTPIVGTEDAIRKTDTITVTYQPVGTLSADGVYTPVLAGQGTGGKQPATYSLARNAQGQWRIRNTVPVGLYITQDDFNLKFAPRSLYFLDSAGTRLVPDLRYSALTEPSVETFLLAQLAAGPRDDRSSAITSFESLPAGNQRYTVTPGSPTVVQVPGAAGLDDPTKYRLAAQLANTLRPTSFQSELEIRDGTGVVSVPGVGDTFDLEDFGDLAAVDDATSTTATYIRDGGVVDTKGQPLSGKLGNGAFDLDSAVFDSDGGRTLVAGTTGSTGPTGQRKLLVGDTSELKPVTLEPGPLTTPAWAPVGTSSDTDEVWVASRSVVYRFVPGLIGARPTTVPISGANSPVAGSITALSFSPEGSRVALVIQSPDGSSSQVYVAAVVRSPDVQLTQLQPVTPTGVFVNDVGWRSDIALSAVGTAPGSTYPTGVYVDVFVDGSRLTLSSPDGLPDRPRTIAVSPHVSDQWVTVVSGSDTTVWTRPSANGTWSTPAGGGSQVGSAPSFST